MGGVRRVTLETDEPVEVGLDDFCEMLNDEHLFRILVFLTVLSVQGL